MSWEDVLFAALMAFGLLASAWQLASRRRTVRAVAQELSLQPFGRSRFGPTRWNWQGREVALRFKSSRRMPDRAAVRIAAAAPSRVRIRSRLARFDILFGPPHLAPRWTGVDVEVWADDAIFVDRLFGDAAIRTQIARAVRERGDEIDIDANQVRVAVQTPRHPSKAAALMTAWTAASTIVERMQLPMSSRRLRTIDLRVG